MIIKVKKHLRVSYYKTDALAPLENYYEEYLKMKRKK